MITITTIMRHKQGFFTVLLSTLALSALLAGTSHAGPPKQILLINSYHEGYKGTDDIVAGFRSVVSSALPDVYIKTEYLDSKNYSGQVYDEKLHDMLRYKYKNRRFDLIVSSDDYAFNIIDKYYSELFSPSPVVFCGTNAFDAARIRGKDYITGIDELPSFKETIELIGKLRPGTRRIVVIHDDSLVGRINSDLFRREAVAFARAVEFEYWPGRTLEDLAERVAALPPDTSVFYFASFVLDRTARSYASDDALKFLSSRSPVPFFGGWEFNLGHGIIGGKLINLFEHGASAGRLAVRVLSGETPASMPRLSPSPNIFMFDDIELRRFQVAYDQLPDTSVIINRRPTFYQQNRAEIFISLSLMLALTVVCIVVFLYRSRRNLQHALNEIRTLQGILPICSSCKKIRDDRGYWQQIEQYIGEHSEAQFSHGVCPECARKLYPQYSDRLQQAEQKKQG